MKTEQPPAPIVLTVNTIIDGAFIRAGDALPFTSAADLPESLKGYVAVDRDSDLIRRRLSRRPVSSA
jgi:hypothetical protein